ncbi:MAG: RNA 2',3'-cyclic phosphodiesterase [Verrucomicrobia bacterium]|nr:RNA 2',3'-cyclic phosphodiesterase [Verrucomicrobiota bacterium]
MASPHIIRLFISLNPRSEIVAKLCDQQAFLRNSLGHASALCIRWTKPTQFHLTLLFLGNFFSQQVEMLKQQITKSVHAQKTLPRLVLHDFGCFPAVQSPRVLWIGATVDEQFEALQESLLQRFSRYVPLDDRDRSYPHITLGRIKSGTADGLSEVLKSLSDESPAICWQPEAVSLMQSVQTSNGVEHCALAEFTPDVNNRGVT